MALAKENPAGIKTHLLPNAGHNFHNDYTYGQINSIAAVYEGFEIL